MSQRQFKLLCQGIDLKIQDVHDFTSHTLISIEDFEEILEKNDWEYLVSFYDELIGAFNQIKDSEIDPNDDEDVEEENLEETLNGYVEELEHLLEKLENVENDIYIKINS